MTAKEILENEFMNKERLDAFYNLQFEPMEFPWLSDVKILIEKTYDVRVMYILYEFTNEKIHRFTLYFYSYDEAQKITLVGGQAFWCGHCAEIEDVISNYFKCNEKIECKTTYLNFENCARRYLFSLLGILGRIRDEIEPLFNKLDPIYLLLGYPIICVLETKEKARDFLLSDYYGTVRKKCFDLLKPHDDYNVLSNEEDIRIIVDHGGNFKPGMYGLWLSEISLEEQKKLEEEIING